MTDILLRHLVRVAAVIIPVSAAVAYMVLGEDVAIGVLVGAILALANGAGLIYFVGQLLAPKTRLGKPALFFLLLGKLSIVAGLLWASLKLWGVSGSGIVIGVGAAIASLTLGVNRGSTSAEGEAAMAAEEARIAQELGDKDADSS